MIEIELKDFQVGKTYYLHHVKDEDTPIGTDTQV